MYGSRKCNITHMYYLSVLCQMTWSNLSIFSPPEQTQRPTVFKSMLHVLSLLKQTGLIWINVDTKSAKRTKFSVGRGGYNLMKMKRKSQKTNFAFEEKSFLFPRQKLWEQSCIQLDIVVNSCANVYLHLSQFSRSLSLSLSSP